MDKEIEEFIKSILEGISESEIEKLGKKELVEHLKTANSLLCRCTGLLLASIKSNQDDPWINDVKNAVILYFIEKYCKGHVKLGYLDLCSEKHLAIDKKEGSDFIEISAHTSHGDVKLH